MDKQCRALIKTARRALALLDPQWIVASELRQALEAASAPATGISKGNVKATGKVNQRTAWMRLANAEMDAWRASGESIADFHKRQNAYYAGLAVKKHQANIVKSGKGFDKKAVAERLEVCACGHHASAHAKDELENLLKCGASNCACDHFHYDATKQAA